MTASQTVGDPAQPASIFFLNADGSIAVKPPTPDSVPVWTNDEPTIQTVVSSANGMSAMILALAPGSDVVRASFTVGGVPYTCEIPVTVRAPALRPASAGIMFGTMPLSTG